MTGDIVHCKNCKHYEQDHFAEGFIVAHHICHKWGKGCITEPDGYCHMGEKVEVYDLIDRRALFKEFGDYMRKMGKDYEPTWNTAVSLIGSMETVYPYKQKGKWIDGMNYINSHWRVC